MGLQSIVNILISRGSPRVTQAGFGRALVLGLHTRFAERQRIYTDPDDMLDDGFVVGDAEYKAAVALMSQAKRPRDFMVGRRTAAVAQAYQVNVAVVANAALYRVPINGSNQDYTSDGSATALEIRDGLIAAINGGSQASKVTATIVDGDSLLITADNAGEAFSIGALSANLTGAETVANNGVIEDIAAVIGESDDWYALGLTSRLSYEMLLAASSIESKKKIFIACSDEAGVLTTSTTDIASQLQDLNYFRTAYLWSGDQDAYPEFGWLGRVLPDDPGSESWKFKTLAGIVADALTAAQEVNAKAKNANTYQTIGGVAIAAEGVMVGGEFIDNTRFIDWVEARMTEAIFQALVDAEKIPFTDQGIGVIENEIRKILEQGKRVGGIAPDPEYTVTVPKAADVPSASKAARTLPDVSFSFTLAGAVHAVDPIEGLVSV